MKNPNHAGFTLIELLVVLLILTILTTIAVQSVDGIQDQSRYEATQRGMQNIEDAVLGPANQREPDGTELITGFVADMGRPPLALMLHSKLQMQELWDNPNGLLPFAIRTSPDDSEVLVPCGWRGPYLRLGVGRTDLLDGWENSYELCKANRDPIQVSEAGLEVSLFRSRGSNFSDPINTGPANDYSGELYINFQTNAFLSPAYPTAGLTDYHASTVVTVTQADGITPPTGTVVVKYFGPDPLTGGIKLIPGTVMSTSPSIHTFDNAAITIGPRIFRAYETSSGKKSKPTRKVLKPLGNTLELRLD